MKRGQNGFGVIETLLVLILLSILGFTGYYVYHARNNTNSTYNNAAQSNSSTPASTGSDKTYNGDGFTLKYPSDWKFEAGNQQAPDDTFTHASNSSTLGAPIIYVENGATTYTKASDDWPVNGSGRAGTVSESKSLTISGYSAYYVVTAFDNSKTYTYDVVHDGKAVNINLTNNTDSQWQTILKQIADSIKFE